MMNKSVSVAITGSGGSGAVTTGQMLLDAMSRTGYYGFMSRSAGPQIRGGESAVMLRFSSQPVYSVDDRFDLLLALDWIKVERFADEIPLDKHSLILCDEDAGDIPELLSASGANFIPLPLVKTAKAIEGGRANMLGLGVMANLTGIPLQSLHQAVQATLGRKGPQVVEVSQECIRQGMEFTVEAEHSLALPPVKNGQNLWNISGNEACGLGALKGGVRFVAAYPITPASEILEWMSPNLEKMGGNLLQAEDELASINMIIGSSFGGVPSLTATSGPGLSLMMEGLGLAVTSETPLVVVNVMRGGPSTGIPTKSEQSDLNLALYGFHGDAPHLVMAPLDIGDCVFTTQWAVSLAEQMQTVGIVLSDQSLGQSRLVMDAPQTDNLSGQRKTMISGQEDYRRYQLTSDGISPMSIPGEPCGMYTADGLEHDQIGTPSSMASDHSAQMEKRLKKIKQFDFADHWAHIEGQGELVIITWGSSSAVSREAGACLRESNVQVRVISLRLLMPLNVEGLSEALAGCTQVVVVEQNQSGQLFQYLHAEKVLPQNATVFARPGPLPVRPGEIVEFIGVS